VWVNSTPIFGLLTDIHHACLWHLQDHFAQPLKVLRVLASHRGAAFLDKSQKLSLKIEVIPVTLPFFYA